MGWEEILDAEGADMVDAYNAGMSGQGMRLSGNSFQNIQCEMPEMP